MREDSRSLAERQFIEMEFRNGLRSVISIIPRFAQALSCGHLVKLAGDMIVGDVITERMSFQTFFPTLGALQHYLTPIYLVHLPAATYFV